MMETNWEHYNELMKNYIANGSAVALNIAGEIRSCSKTDCSECMFNDSTIYCSHKRSKWLNAEYKELS